MCIRDRHKYDVSLLKDLIREHVELTGSPRGKEILDNFGEYLPKFKKLLKSDLVFDIFDLRFHEAGNANLSFQRHFFRDDFAVIQFTLVSYFFGICLKISDFVRCIVVQHINRLFARVRCV